MDPLHIDPLHIDRYAVVGHPIAHSKSPAIHSAFAAQTGQSLTYEALLAPLDGFAATIGAFFGAGGRGLNVTVPFKLEAYALCQAHTPRAQAAESVNTLWMADGRLHGDNTDGAGLVTDLKRNLDCTLQGRHILLVGAGGAARGVMAPLLAEAPARLVVVNRSADKATDLAARFGVAGGSLQSVAGERFDLVINATASSLADAAPDLPARLYAEGALGYDMFYGPRRTPFLEQAAADGAARLADGLGMLVEQAAEAFAGWRGVRPETAPVLAHLRASLAAADRRA
jgi:shikimate dehydrogenase